MSKYAFSHRSKAKLATCDEKLQSLFGAVIDVIDCTVLCGYRGKEEQTEAFETGRSKLEWGKSLHNNRFAGQPNSRAVDVIPYPIDWQDTKRFYYFGGVVGGIASQLGISLRLGLDWDGDNDLNDQTFMDLVHFELRDR